MIRQLSARHRAALLVIAVPGALLLDWLWLGSARCAGLVAARARLGALRIELAAARREAAARADTKEAVREAARALRRAAARLPDQRELGALLAAVAGGARDARLELLLLRPKPERAVADHVEVPVELHVRGSYLEALGFLRGLERLGRLVHIADLRIARPAQTQARDGVVVEVRCTAVTYRLAGDGERRAAPAPHGEGPG